MSPAIDEHSASSAAPHIRIFNVKFSPNLGDGLLSECLEQALIACGAHEDSWSIDLAGRTHYSDGSEQRSLKLRVLEAMPGFIRPLAVRLPLALAASRQWAPHYRANLTNCDGVMIGGGNLLADLDLNFPTKLALAINTAAQRGLPVVIYGCGVSSGWSKRGLALLNDALATGAVKAVFVRDTRSQELWDQMFGDAHNLPAGVVRDPGLLACNSFALSDGNSSRRGHTGRKTIGLNITSQLAVKYHSSDAPSPEQLRQFYLDFAAKVLEAGNDLCVFTNGSPEDRVALSELRAPIDALAPESRVHYPDATTPAQLVKIIDGLDGILAFRMHAIIAAYSCGTPFCALSWDPKLDSFVQSVNQANRILRVTQSSGADAARVLAQAMADGIDEAERQQIVLQAQQDVARAYTALRGVID